MTALERCRRRCGMSQVELAMRSGVSRETICRIEAGKADLGSKVKVLAIIAALAWALDIDVTELAEHADRLPLGPRKNGEKVPLHPEQVA